MDNQLIAALNEALNRELATFIRYLIQGSLIQGLTNEPLRAMYRRELSDEMGHAQYLADKIVTLGGSPTANPDLTPPPLNISEMIQNDLDAEKSDVAHYTKLARMADEVGDLELKLRMEEQAADETRHAQELQRMQSLDAPNLS